MVHETLTGHRQRVAAKERTARQAVEECLTRCDTLEPQLHAWVILDREAALARADELDRERALGNEPGPLFGVPVAIKDLFDVAGWPTGCGSPLLSQGPAATDGPLIRRLRQAGAVILGKTVTTQFACFDPPATRNPWNLDRTPGGSSSGSAAAVASGMCLAALGSQTGGSITRPASFCGVCGLKPSFGRLPVMGVYPVAPSLDHPGPIARTAADLQVLFEVLKSDSHPALPVAARPGTITPRSIGRLRGMFESQADVECGQRLEATLERLQGLGVSVADCPLPPEFDTVIRSHRTLMVGEIAAQHQQRLNDHPEDYLPGIRGLIEEGCRLAATDYVRAREHQRRLCIEMDRCFDRFDILACPSTKGGAPTPETTGDPAFNSPWSYTGLPTVTIPMGLDRDGMPLGLQLIGRRNHDETLLSCAAWCEERLARHL
ncbi:MAG: amidase [Planctomycetaceae bacterium]|nr:MAG: amidase [Planctomycetaceae bacterium]